MKKSQLLLLLLLMAGCTFFRSPGKDECDKILSREKMTDLLTDIYLLEGYLLELQSINPAMQDSVADYFAGVFDRHGVTYQEFDQALSCYLLHEREMQQIHEEVLQRFSIMESQVEPSMPEAQSPGGQEMDGRVPEGMDGQAMEGQVPEGLQDSIPDHRLR